MKILKGIYMIHCTASKKNYIGSSKNIKNRWKRHKHELKKGCHDNEHMQNAWLKYGATSFIFSVLEELQADDLIPKEKEWVKHYDACNREYGYNKCIPGEVSEETRMKMRKKRSGQVRTYKTIYRIQGGLITKTNSKELIEEGFTYKNICNVLGYWSNLKKGIIKDGMKSYKGNVFIREKDYDVSFDYIKASTTKQWVRPRKSEDADHKRAWRKAYEKKLWTSMTPEQREENRRKHREYYKQRHQL